MSWVGMADVFVSKEKNFSSSGSRSCIYEKKILDPFPFLEDIFSEYKLGLNVDCIIVDAEATSRKWL